MEKIPVAILGARGIIGQVFVSMLAEHDWFEIVYLISSQVPGEVYGESTRWLLPEPMPDKAATSSLCDLDIRALIEAGVRFVFCALPADAAGVIEPKLRENGFLVFSNSSVMRLDPSVPILIPEVNPGSIELIEDQGFPDKGFVITNANCTTTGLALALAPLRNLGIERLHIATYQAISGAGYPGLSALDIGGNVIPHIENEEEKVDQELFKILEISPETHAFCARVPVAFGHIETVWVELRDDFAADGIVKAWEAFVPPFTTISTPVKPIIVDDRIGYPRPEMSFLGTPPGMSVYVGTIKRKGNVMRFTLLVNNVVRGGAGGSILNAELFVKRYGDLI